MLEDLNFAQRERLAFIDFCLQYFGQVARADLVQKFRTGLASCSRDLSLYRELAPNNATLVHQSKQYLRTADFEPLFEHDPEVILSALARGFGDGISGGTESSKHCINAIRLIHPKSEVVAAIMRAINSGSAVKCRYHSLSSGASSRTIVPHAIIDNGHRWHVRAYDRKTSSFRDFVCSRFENIVEVHAPVKAQETEANDTDWNSILELEIVPHPSIKHPKAIEMDFDMKNGKLLIDVRAALAGYLLRQWQVDCSSVEATSTEGYQLRLNNLEQLEGIASLAMAPRLIHKDIG
ncbi:WYL domain-containing protein [Neiella marina]|uniref:WYL domain-containing protein n=1 Tax=Neiella marina TaxID=508461 RepID=UPI00280631C4|nr:WYL domain-containing protein [Neiella marina]